MGSFGPKATAARTWRGIAFPSPWLSDERDVDDMRLGESLEAIVAALAADA
jgi:hypothetical protein